VLDLARVVLLTAHAGAAATDSLLGTLADSVR